MSFNQNHPELGRGEVFLINIAKEQLADLLVAKARERRELKLEGFNFSYYRIGNYAYDGEGNFRKGARPIFVSQRENSQQCAT
jgi:hypothetical protein